MRARRVTVGASLASIALSGCAQRRLVAGPSSRPSAATWTTVWVAGALAVVVVGVLLTLPAWRQRTGARAAVAVLTLQTGAVSVAAVVLGGMAVRSWQLIDRPEGEQAASLVRLSGIDGDTGFFALMVLLVVLGGGLFATMSALATRFAAADDGWERLVASALLALELGAASYLVVRFALGARAWPFTAGTAAAPILLAALITCWPRRPTTT